MFYGWWINFFFQWCHLIGWKSVFDWLFVTFLFGNMRLVSSLCLHFYIGLYFLVIVLIFYIGNEMSCERLSFCGLCTHCHYLNWYVVIWSWCFIVFCGKSIFWFVVSAIKLYCRVYSIGQLAWNLKLASFFQLLHWHYYKKCELLIVRIC